MYLCEIGLGFSQVLTSLEINVMESVKTELSKPLSRDNTHIKIFCRRITIIQQKSTKTKINPLSQKSKSLKHFPFRPVSFGSSSEFFNLLLLSYLHILWEEENRIEAPKFLHVYIPLIFTQTHTASYKKIVLHVSKASRHTIMETIYNNSRMILFLWK